MDKELERVKEQVKNHLDRLGYNGKAVADKVVKVTGYFRGEPSKVKLDSGIEIYL